MVRSRPLTYREVVLDLLRFDWLRLGDNYDSVVSDAVDAPGADGHAFVTEYAGPSTVVDPASVKGASWNAEDFRGAAPEQVIDLLESQGLVTCTALGCTAVEPLVLSIVRKFLPAPSGIRESDFYGCLACNRTKIDRAAWDADAFATELEDLVIAPGKHAAEMLASAPYVTRLFTRISPDEMTVDPEFTTLPRSAGDVSSALVAGQNRTCGGDLALELPGRPAVALEGGAMPGFARTAPAALTVTEYDQVGTRTVLFDNASDIDARIEAYDRERGFPPGAPGGPSGGACSGGGCGTTGTETRSSGAIAAALALSLLRRTRRRRAARAGASVPNP